MLLDQVEREVAELHQFFVEWFTGKAEASDKVFEDRFIRRFSPEIVLIQPGGQRVTGEQLGGMRQGHGSSPNFSIQIRNVEIRHSEGDTVVAMYEEWQRGAKNSTPTSNGRISTVVFLKRENRLIWHLVHETWIPAEIVAAEPFDWP